MGVLRDEIAKNLLYYRKKIGMTQKELASKLGVKNNTISQWENGTNSIDVDTLLIVCNILAVAFEDMFGIYAKRQEGFSIEEEDIIKKFRELDDRGKSTVLSVIDQQYEYLDIPLYKNDRDAFIKKYARPYAAADGDVTNLEEAQRLFDESDYIDEDEG